MESIQEIIYTGICKCCLVTDNLKNLWSRYYNEGDTEIYGHMMIECFVLPWNEPEDPENNEQICEECVSKLRSAYNFRKQVLNSEQQLNQQFSDVEWEANEKLSKIKEETNEENLERGNHAVEPLENCYIISYEIENDDDTNDAEPPNYHNEDYEVVDLLENDEEYKTLEKKSGKDTIIGNTNEFERKLPRRKRKDVLKPYKDYTQDDLKNAIEAVNNQKMNNSTAAIFYNVPRKTLAAHLRKQLNEPKSIEDGKEEATEQPYKFITEIKKILIYTNATPFRNTPNCYYCIYCIENPPYFTDAEELRLHVKVGHASERIKKLDIFMRPYGQNEIIKMDVHNLICTVCCTMISDWKEMLTHLKEIHNEELELAHYKVIPYILTSNKDCDIKCALCEEKFPNINLLQKHMNSHYRTYLCSECGDAFLTKSRLQAHFRVHSVRKFPCELCGKVFTRELYRKKHFDIVHNKYRYLKCKYCDEKFYGEDKRRSHIAECHKERVQYWNCQLCSKSFDWRPYYVRHLRRRHNSQTGSKSK